MRERIQARLEELRAEFELGQQTLGDLERQQAEVNRRMLRISGAMQVLEELLAEDVPADGDEAASAGTERAASSR